MSPATPTPQLIPAKQAAKITGHSRQTLHRWVKSGKLHPVLLSRRVMFLEDDLRNLIISAQPKAQEAR